MSKEQYKQKSGDALRDLLETGKGEDFGLNKLTNGEIVNAINDKLPEIIEQVCGDDNTPEQKQIILEYCISENIIGTFVNEILNFAGVSVQEWLKTEILPDINKFIVKHQTKPKTGTTAHSKKKHKDFEKKVARMKKLYRFFKDKGFREQQCYNLISSKHYPEHSPSTVETYINKK